MEELQILECEKCGWMGTQDLADVGSADGSNEVAVCPQCEGFLYIKVELEVVPITPAGLHDLLEEL